MNFRSGHMFIINRWVSIFKETFGLYHHHLNHIVCYIKYYSYQYVLSKCHLHKQPPTYSRYSRYSRIPLTNSRYSRYSRYFINLLNPLNLLYIYMYMYMYMHIYIISQTQAAGAKGDGPAFDGAYTDPMHPGDTHTHTHIHTHTYTC